MTIDELNKLTDDEVRVRVARAIGLNVVDLPFTPNKVAQDSVFTKAAHERIRQVYPGGLFRRIPNYPADLNAMHEAEKTLGAKWEDYLKALYQTNGNLGWGSMPHATARQRAIAFLAVTEQPMKGR